MLDTLTSRKTKVECVQKYAVLGKRMPDQNVSRTQNFIISKPTNIDKLIFYYFQITTKVSVFYINISIHDIKSGGILKNDNVLVLRRLF